MTTMTLGFAPWMSRPWQGVDCTGLQILYDSGGLRWRGGRGIS